MPANNDLVLIRSSLLTDIADAIRTKTGSEALIYPADMDTEILSIQTGIVPTSSINITTNGTHDVTNYASAVVNVPTGGTGGEHTIAYPTNLEHQSITVAIITNDTDVGGVYTANPCGYQVYLSAGSGYEPGHIVIDGVDSSHSSATFNPLFKNVVITATPATLKTYDNILLDAVLTPALSSSSSQYYYDVGYYFSYEGSTDNYGSLTPNSFTVDKTYYTETVTIKTIVASSNGQGLMLEGSGLYNLNLMAVIIGDPTTEYYWVYEGTQSDMRDYQFAGLAEYFYDCANNGTTVPFKIANLD